MSSQHLPSNSEVFIRSNLTYRQADTNIADNTEDWDDVGGVKAENIIKSIHPGVCSAATFSRTFVFCALIFRFMGHTCSLSTKDLK